MKAFAHPAETLHDPRFCLRLGTLLARFIDPGSSR
jgi:hypothetical protein